jgi:two-component system, sensor histidine kinase PdtaS
MSKISDTDSENRQIIREHLTRCEELIGVLKGSGDEALEELIHHIRKTKVLIGNKLSEDNLAGESWKSSEELDTQRYSLMFSHSPLGLMHFSSDGTITECNEQFVKIIGSSREALVGLDMKELPDKKVVAALREALQGKAGHYDGVYHSTTADKVTPVHAIFIPLKNSEGDVVGGMAIIEDITEKYLAQKALEESESRYRSLFENNHSVMLLIDPDDGAILDANQAASHYYGLSRDELLQMKISKISTLSRKQVLKKLKTTADNSSNVSGFRHRAAGGEIRDVEVYSGTMRAYGRNLLCCIVHDITERKEMELQISRSLQEKSLMLAEIHHRVKNNLALISSLLTLQAYKTDDDELAAKLMEGTMRIKTIANVHEQIYDTEEFAGVDVADLSLKLAMDIPQNLNKQQLQVDFYLRGGEVSLGISTSVYLLLIVNEVISNIVRHAFKTQDEGTVVISFEKSEKELIMKIKDDGTALPEGLLSTLEKGLGLELIEILTRQLNGTSGFKRVSGEKANQFTLNFPLSERPENLFSYRGSAE